MKQALLTAIFTAILLCLIVFGYKYYRERKEMEEFTKNHLENSIQIEWLNTELLASGTGYNIDSLRRKVFDSTKEGAGRLGEILMAQDTIKMRYKNKKISF